MNKREHLKSMTDQILRLLEADGERQPDQEFMPPVETHNDAELFDLEKEKLFGSQALMAGLSCDIPNPGDFFTRDDLGIPIIITRDNDGKAHALLNICTHRAARLKEGFGNARSLSCPYHAWNFGLDGTLRKVFKQDSFGSIEKCEYDLDKISCQEKYGMIFICFDSESPLDIDNHLGNMAPSLDIWELNQLRFIGEREWEIDENWKYALDMICDGYCFDIDPETPENNNRLRHAVGYDRFGPVKQHHRMTFPNSNIIEFKDLDHQKTGESALESFKIVHFLFPNVAFTVSKATVECLTVYPGEHNNEQVLRLRSYNRASKNGLEEESEAESHFETLCVAINSKAKRLNSGDEPKTEFTDNRSMLPPSSQVARINILQGILETLQVYAEETSH